MVERGEGVRPVSPQWDLSFRRKCRARNLIGCDGDHVMRQCDKLLSLGLAERKDVLERSGLCTFCLKHSAKLECFFFYNVFRATRYKTTSLPAALNQARRIDTLLRNCIVMHYINRSRIYWRPSLLIVLRHRQGQITNTNNLQASYRLFLCHEVLHRKYMKIPSCQCSNLLCNEWC
jgi:hypothetical protein